MNAIKLWNDSRQWNATFTGPHASEIQRLFGTDTLPTGFTAAAPSWQVEEEVRRRNPGVEVNAVHGGRR
jgi:hypothetical protein